VPRHRAVVAVARARDDAVLELERIGEVAALGVVRVAEDVVFLVARVVVEVAVAVDAAAGGSVIRADRRARARPPVVPDATEAIAAAERRRAASAAIFIGTVNDMARAGATSSHAGTSAPLLNLSL
jgi:hypothetical protein